MSLKLNPTVPAYRDKIGQYVEVLGVVGKKVVLTYAEENIETIEYDNASSLKIGQRLYFGLDGEYDPKLKTEVVEHTATTSNKQSPVSLPKDKNSRY